MKCAFLFRRRQGHQVKHFTFAVIPQFVSERVTLAVALTNGRYEKILMHLNLPLWMSGKQLKGVPKALVPAHLQGKIQSSFDSGHDPLH